MVLPTQEIPSHNLPTNHVHLYIGASLERRKRDKLLQDLATNYVRDPLYLSYLPNGKPFFRGADLHLSLSHTREKLLVAFARFAIGADLEAVTRQVSARAIARRHFFPTEYAALEACPEEEFHKMFFRIWIRKEAAVKMTGEGLAVGLRKIRVDPTRQGWSVWRDWKALFIQEIALEKGEMLGALVGEREFSVTVCGKF